MSENKDSHNAAPEGVAHPRAIRSFVRRAGRTPAICAVASPMPKPISRMVGASRPKALAKSSGCPV